MTTQIQQSDIRDWLNSVHMSEYDWIENGEYQNYLPRMGSVRRRIEELAAARGDSHDKTNQTMIINHLRIIKNAITYYSIPPESSDEFLPLWYGHTKGESGKPEKHGGMIWWDFLGDPSIREAGGIIVVMLSQKGVDDLNELTKTLKVDTRLTQTTT